MKTGNVCRFYRFFWMRLIANADDGTGRQFPMRWRNTCGPALRTPVKGLCVVRCRASVLSRLYCGRHSLVLGVAALTAIGCQSGVSRDSRSEVAADLASRFGVTIGEQDQAGESVLPPSVSLDDGLSEDEAAQIALWNNAAFQEMLAQLGVSNAQLLDAGLIADPQFSIFLPVGPKQFEFTTFQAVDALWLQPIRVRASELDVDRVGQSMVQNGLDVIRDARVAHVNFVVATDQAALAREAEELRKQIADLAQKRLDAGDISELEATTSRIDALQAKAAADRAVHDVTLARQQLQAVLGLTGSSELRVQSPVPNPPLISVDSGHSSLDSSVDEALAARPDLRAAEIAIEVAGERAGLARNQFMNLDAIYDANGKGQRGSYESGPGLRFTIPVFNGNQGGIAIADAQWEQAVRRYVTVRDQVTLDVRNAHTRHVQASENLKTLQVEILPALKQAEELARRNYENGATPYFFVLQTTDQYLGARMRELEVAADLARATAELERSVGVRVQSATVESRESSVQSVAVQRPASRGQRYEDVNSTWDSALPRLPEHSQIGGWHATR